jgi:hypothetical protein
LLQGLGDAIRGNVNTLADSAVHTDSSKSRAVAERGEEEFKSGHYVGTGAGVTPADTDRERVNREVQGEHTTFDHSHHAHAAATPSGATASTGTTHATATTDGKLPFAERSMRH